ncbi:transposase [Oceanobacillus halophilus]|uniref:Transposase n=1 Tax=Oceanobacillus halophilus TaxID=930130 RepID=A0A495A8D4_9BACI|nr:transposase [Oceanobacillus halophilus]RKQ35844.1 transposase [Oceanobacillus halophilus]
MARKKRMWQPDYYYHITSRGNRKGDLFSDEEDYKVFLHILKEVNSKVPFDLIAYCLMSNHYHLQIRSQHSLSKVMFLINKRYANYFNNKNGWTGHVFEKRFYSAQIDSYLGMLKVNRYIHLNPIEAGIVKDALEYRWSSYYDYLHPKQVRFSLINTDTILEIFFGSEMDKRKKYMEYMNQEEEITLEIPIK